MKKIIVADDHEIVRYGARVILENISSEFEIIEASTCKEVLQIIDRQEIDFGIFDIQLVDGNMFSIISQIIEQYPNISILVYSMNAEKIYAKRLLKKGIKAFVCKQESIGELEKAIKCLLNGEVYLSSAFKENVTGNAELNLEDNPFDLLSDRELEVAEYSCEGLRAKEIARRMDLDITTVSTFRRRAYKKLNVENAIELKEIMALYRL